MSGKAPFVAIVKLSGFQSHSEASMLSFQIMSIAPSILSSPAKTEAVPFRLSVKPPSSG